MSRLFLCTSDRLFNLGAAGTRHAGQVTLEEGIWASYPRTIDERRARPRGTFTFGGIATTAVLGRKDKVFGWAGGAEILKQWFVTWVAVRVMAALATRSDARQHSSITSRSIRNLAEQATRARVRGARSFLLRRVGSEMGRQQRFTHPSQCTWTWCSRVSLSCKARTEARAVLALPRGGRCLAGRSPTASEVGCDGALPCPGGDCRDPVVRLGCRYGLRGTGGAVLDIDLEGDGRVADDSPTQQDGCLATVVTCHLTGWPMAAAWDEAHGRTHTRTSRSARA